MIVDLFAGPGGFSEGMRLLGLSDVGIEIDRDACATRAAAGHLTIRADVSTYPAERFIGRCEGLVASPPCTDFSSAGLRKGRKGRTGQLVDQVPRWVDILRPRWVACEQVPPVLPIWQQFARILEGWGYRTWAGLLSSECFGVPQTRSRAILMASLDGPVRPPVSTHQRYESKVPQGDRDACREKLFEPAVKPWVSMADALGWEFDLPAFRRPNAGRSNSHPNRAVRAVGEPAPTIAFGHDVNSWRWESGRVLHTNRDQRPDGSRQTVADTRPAPALTSKAGGQWAWRRPATTVCGDPRLGSPGHRDREGGERQFSDDAMKLTIEEALVLQSFRRDYPLQGNKTSQFSQCGNAIPVLMAAAIVGELTGRSIATGEEEAA